jgi:tyrosinase
MYLNIENVTTTGRPRNYSVYVNLPEGASADVRTKHYAGEMPTFGARESSRPDATHPGGVHYTFDVTEIVRSLEAAGSWDPTKVHVVFVPEEDLPSAAFGAVEPPPIHVGRISFYAQ